MKATIFSDQDFGISWVIDELMERASHAIVDDGKVWLIDPVDWQPALEKVAELGEPAGVIQLLDRHNRAGAAIAERLRVPLHRLPRELPDSPFKPRRLIKGRFWNEVVLWWPEREVLVVPEAVGTSSYFAVGKGDVGVHPLLRLLPPKRLRDFQPQHLLVGHGPPLHQQVTPALNQALDRSRRDLPTFIAKLPSFRP